MHNILCMNWPELIRHRREACGLTQTELAVQAGVSLPSIQKMEAGRANPSLKTLRAVFKVVGVELVFKIEDRQDSLKNQKSKAPSLLEEVAGDFSELTSGSARSRVNRLFKLLDKVTDPKRKEDES